MLGAKLRHAYDAGDQRVLKTAIDSSGNQRHTVYVFDSLELRRAAYGVFGSVDDADYELSKTTEVPYLFANGVRLARVAWEDLDVPSIGQSHLHVLFELGDHLGSTSVVLDGATSELVERSTFQAYGAAESDYRPARWAGFREDYRFTGKEEDVEVGLQYFGKRYYAPLLGRWVSADPLAIHALGAELNVYAYVSGRALQSIDPMGLEESRVSSVADTGMPAPQPTQKPDGTIEMPEMVITGELRALAPDSEAWRQGPGGGTGQSSQCWGGGTGCVGDQKIPVENIAFPGEPGGAAATLGGITANKIAGHDPTAQDWAAFSRAGAAEMLGGAGRVARGSAPDGMHAAPAKPKAETGGPYRTAAKPAPGGKPPPSRWKPGPHDADWRGSNKTFADALKHAFARTGVARDEFKVTRWGKDKHGKSFPAEWRAPGGAEVNVDWPHGQDGPTAPHVGWQQPGSRGSGAKRGHILLDEVPYNR